jgi:hypothetical protein
MVCPGWCAFFKLLPGAPAAVQLQLQLQRHAGDLVAHQPHLPPQGTHHAAACPCAQHSAAPPAAAAHRQLAARARAARGRRPRWPASGQTSGAAARATSPPPAPPRPRWASGCAPPSTILFLGWGAQECCSHVLPAGEAAGQVLCPAAGRQGAASSAAAAAGRGQRTWLT